MTVTGQQVRKETALETQRAIDSAAGGESSPVSRLSVEDRFALMLKNPPSPHSDSK